MTTFNSKETYLAYRSTWKAKYKSLSQTIRELKQETRERQRKNENAGYQQYYLITQKKTARAMLTELEEAKAEAQRQYLAAKAQKVELITA